MPNGHDLRKEYGQHKYAGHDGTSDCKYECGCWMGPARSGGPLGVDPFGECPGNPKDGKPLGGKSDYEVVVERRISGLEHRAYAAEQKLKSVSPSKLKLAEELESVRKELLERNQLLREVHQKVSKVAAD